MKIICAWCKRDMGTCRGGPRGAVTSGICDECHKEQLKQFGQPLQEFLDTLPVPVLLVGPDSKVLGANERARALRPKRLPRIDDRFGDAIGCVNADTTGCGKSVHCQSCAIRRTVQATFETGKPCKDVPAYRDIEVDSRIKHLNLRLTTELRGKCVLLRIEEEAEAALTRDARKAYRRPGGRS